MEGRQVVNVWNLPFLFVLGALVSLGIDCKESLVKGARR